LADIKTSKIEPTLAPLIKAVNLVATGNTLE